MPSDDERRGAEQSCTRRHDGNSVPRAFPARERTTAAAGFLARRLERSRRPSRGLHLSGRGARPRRLQLREQPQWSAFPLSPFGHRLRPTLAQRGYATMPAHFRQVPLGQGFYALIRYRVRLADLDRHWFEIECRVEDAADEQRFSLPAWIPGQLLAARLRAPRRSRRGQERARSARRRQDRRRGVVRARRGGTLDVHDHGLRPRPIRARRLSRRAARLLQRPVRVRAAAKAATPSRSRSRSSRRRTRRAKTGTSRRRSTSAEVDERGFGTYRAGDYDELLDHPVEISDFESVEFEAAGVPHRLVVAGRFESDLDRVATDLALICTTQIEFFGRPAPFDRYWFLGLAVGEGYGGLEHRASTSLIFGRDDLPKARRRDTVARLSALPRARESRVLSHLAREAHETRGVHAVSLGPAQSHAPAVGLRRNHELLPGAHAAAQRRRRLERVPPAHGRAADARLQDAGPVQAEPGAVELRRVGRAVSARAASREHVDQLLHEGRDGRARARSQAAARHGRPHVARRRRARALAPLRRARRRRSRGRLRAARRRSRRPRPGAVLRRAPCAAPRIRR